MRHVTESGLTFMKGWERFRAAPYDDGYGFMTIGYGHLMRPGEYFSGDLSEDDGLVILARDVGVAERAVLRLTRVPLSDGQYDALVSLTFNAGAGAYQRSQIRMLVNRGEFGNVAEMFPRSFITSGGVRSSGLIRRRVAEAGVFRV